VPFDRRPEGGTSRKRTTENLVRIVDEQLDSRARAPSLEWVRLVRVVRVDLMKEERSGTDL
jgi:hypothetical protein